MSVEREPFSKELVERGSALVGRTLSFAGRACLRLAVRSSERRSRLAYSLSYRSNLPLTKPRGVSVEVSSACNLRCRICSQWRDPPGKQSLTPEDLRRIIAEMSRSFPGAVVEFSGQEPTLNRPLLMDALAYAQERGVPAALSTNGMLITQEYAKEIIATHPHHVSVSLDSVTPAIHDYLRNSPGSHSKASAAVKRLAEEKLRQGAQTAVSVTSVVCSQTVQELVGLHGLAGRLGADTINYNAFVLDNSYFLAREQGYGSEFWIGEDKMAELRSAVERLICLKRSKELPLITNDEWQLREMPRYFQEKERFVPRRCLAGYNYLHIHKHGDATVCGKGPFLNVKQYSLGDIWHSLSFARTRRAIRRCAAPCINNCYVLE